MGDALRCSEANGEQDALRIYDVARPAPRGINDISADMTLSQFVEIYYKPVHLLSNDSRPRNLEEIDKSVEYWVRFTTKGGAIAEPALNAITVFHCADFINGLKQLPGRKYPKLGNNTIRKHAAAIQSIIDICGQPDRKFRNALGILDRLPYIARPRKQIKEAEDCFTFAEIEQLIENADVATLPNHLPCTAGTYLRRLFVFIFNTSARITGAMESEWRHFHGSHLILPARIAAKGTNDKRVEINDAAREVIESMRGCDARRIFPWPHSWPVSRSNLYGQLGLVRQCLPENRRFGFHAIRKLTNNELARINPKACEKVLGHQRGATNVESYTSRVIASEALSKLPALRMTRDTQARLFD